MWKIKHIFDGEYGCEESDKNLGPAFLLTLEDETGNVKRIRVSDTLLTRHSLTEGSKWPYKFWGFDNCDVVSLSSRYPNIKTPFDLYDALSHIWCADTCAPRMRQNWSKEDMTLGQCSITAFLAQDIFGGKVYGILRPGGNYHCYNVCGTKVFDLTSEQFHEEILDYTENPEQFREVHFSKEEKRLRYEYLCRKLSEYSFRD